MHNFVEICCEFFSCGGSRVWRRGAPPDTSFRVAHQLHQIHQHHQSTNPPSTPPPVHQLQAPAVPPMHKHHYQYTTTSYATNCHWTYHIPPGQNTTKKCRLAMLNSSLIRGSLSFSINDSQLVSTKVMTRKTRNE